jgi:hypothetical protein
MTWAKSCGRAATTSPFRTTCLVTINVDDCEFSSVQVSARNTRTYLAAIEDSIESLIVIRDQLRSMTVAA